MHEAKLCLSLIEMAEAQLRDAGGDRILALRIEVGSLSGVVPEALEAAFPICASGTSAEDASLRIERKSGRSLILRDMEVI